jgi:hypothetical protein
VSSIESATRELCKYITKSDSWSAVPKEHLLEMALVARWPKMFSLGGTFAVAAARLERQRAAARPAARSTTTASSAETGYLDTKSLSGISLDELSEETKAAAKELTKKKKKANWRKLVRENGYGQYKMVLAAQVSKHQSYRKRQLGEKYSLSTFRNLNGKVWYSPRLEFVEEYNETTGETLIWNAPKPVVVEMDFDEARARAEYPAEFEEFEYIPEEPEYFADYIPEHFEEPDYFEFKTVREMEHAAVVLAAKPIPKPVAVAAVQEYSEFDEFGW